VVLSHEALEVGVSVVVPLEDHSEAGRLVDRVPRGQVHGADGNAVFLALPRKVEEELLGGRVVLEQRKGGQYDQRMWV
jgi:hypothetical protein